MNEFCQSMKVIATLSLTYVFFASFLQLKGEITKKLHSICKGAFDEDDPYEVCYSQSQVTVLLLRFLRIIATLCTANSVRSVAVVP